MDCGVPSPPPPSTSQRPRIFGALKNPQLSHLACYLVLASLAYCSGGLNQTGVHSLAGRVPRRLRHGRAGRAPECGPAGGRLPRRLLRAHVRRPQGPAVGRPQWCVIQRVICCVIQCGPEGPRVAATRQAPSVPRSFLLLPSPLPRTRPVSLLPATSAWGTIPPRWALRAISRLSVAHDLGSPGTRSFSQSTTSPNDQHLVPTRLPRENSRNSIPTVFLDCAAARLLSLLAQPQAT